MLLVDFKRSKRMRYFHGSETECMFKNEVLSASVIVGCAARVPLEFSTGETFFLVMACRNTGW